VVIEDKDNNTIPKVVPETVKVEPPLIVTGVGITKAVSEGKLDTAISAKPNFLSTITKKEVHNNQNGLQVTYVDLINGLPDTITLLIPPEWENNRDSSKPKGNNELNDTTLKKGVNDALTKEDVLVQQSANNLKSIDTIQKDSQNLNKQNSEIISPAKAEKNDDKKFLDIDLSNSGQSKADNANVEKAAGNPTEQFASNALMINSNCKVNALEEDFLKLRKKMASAKTADEMVSNAKKVFKAKCFTTDQIKNLGVLFLNDSGRYNFFDVAYPFVSDSNNYKLLENQLIDPYYKSRFQAMILH
jgi:hypothetical protein